VSIQLTIDVTHKDELVRPSRSGGNVWAWFAAVTVIVIILSAICWSLAHAYGTYWDEAQYLNEVSTDLSRLRNGALLRLGGRIFLGFQPRPPAYRLLALPFLALTGFHATIARLSSLVWFALSAWFIYGATRRMASQVAAACSVLIFCLSPEIVSASIHFGTEGPLYLATSAMLYYLFACWDGGSHRPTNWIGLGLALGLGFLSKTTFIAIALPVLALWIVAGRWAKNIGLPRLTALRKAGALALLLAAPWWLLHARDAFGLAQYARGYVRHSLGPHSLLTWAYWLNTVFQCLWGHGTGVLIGLIAITGAIKIYLKKEIIFDPLQKAALGACACAGVPCVLLQLSGMNDQLRHISPAVIPLAIALGVFADQTGWTDSRAAVTLSGTLFCAQLFMIVFPVAFPNKRPVDKGFITGTLPWRVMARVDQWDWRQMRELSKSCGVETPKISYVGNGMQLNPPQIEYPWVPWAPNIHSQFDAAWLWRYEDGPPDWQKLMDSAAESDFVLTAPHYLGDPGAEDRQDLDNRYNAEFADRLSRDPRFQGPISLKMGRFQPVELAVFAKKTLSCHWDGKISPDQ
jgi:4-amino-4-deoxy-L-arabinose transferase-like glycosyltransferase